MILKPEEVQAIKLELESNRAKLAQLEASLSATKATANNNETLARLAIQRTKLLADNECELDPADDSFELCGTKIGALAVFVEKIKPKADGSTLIARVGNPYSALITNVAMNTCFGGRMPDLSDPDQIKELGQWDKSLKCSSASIKSLKAGSWTAVEVNLPGVPPEKLGYLKNSIDFDGLSLSQN